ncbi:zinc finger CCCH domain-containing protein 16 [Rutidosis leptorrhynchoides]|uniref:zinc finger CCCH domain-containing protein 16 n=1 Tax=Rutidosis leptorrhynchoides TaxID=125765 RepID=UPI003A98D02D
MPPRKEPCRNFQRGFCQYGERCKFLHVNQQQAKPNPFGFGTQTNSQPQKPNPFGFGTQNNSQTGTNTNQFKPGENTWSRFAQKNGGTSAAPQKKDNQSAAANHVCTDSESCKRQMREDFEHEKPLWKLTCYGHAKYGPCDIVGDLSYEELRAAVYDEAKRGASIQSIVEKERSLLSSKLIEFENLLRNPCTPSQSSASTTQNALPGTNTNVFPQTIQQNNGPPSVSSFSQLGTNFNAGFQMRPAASNNVFGQVNQFQTSTQIPNASKNSFAFGNPGQTVNQPSTQSFKSFPATTTTFGNAFSTAATPRQQSSMPFGGHNPSSTNVAPQPASGIQITTNTPNSNSNGDNSIWFKEEWRAGEIPEEAPPDGVVY